MLNNPQTSWDAAWASESNRGLADLDAPTLQNVIDAAKVAFIGADLPSRGSAIEVGCGSARLLVRAGRGRELRLIALDQSTSALQLARSNSAREGTAVALLRGEVTRLPIAAESCDLVLSGGLLEHFANPQPVLSEMVRILRPGGVFYADVVPRRFSLYRLRELPRLITSAWLMEGVYESSFGPRHYRAWLQDLRCTDIRVQSCGVYPPWKPLMWQRWSRRLDGTLLASLMGWYFMIAARKAAR